jgi:hypothetical protein
MLLQVGRLSSDMAASLLTSRLFNQTCCVCKAGFRPQDLSGDKRRADWQHNATRAVHQMQTSGPQIGSNRLKITSASSRKTPALLTGKGKGHALKKASGYLPPPWRPSQICYRRRAPNKQSWILASGAEHSGGESDKTTEGKKWWNPFGLFQGRSSAQTASDSEVDLDGEPPAPSKKTDKDARPEFRPLGTRSGPAMKKDTQVRILSRSSCRSKKIPF